MEYILERSKLFIFLILILMLVGVYTFLTLPQREIPETPPGLVLVSTILPGAEPEEVRAWLVERYGDYVSYRPQVSSITWPLFAIPAVLLVAALLILRRRLGARP